MKNKICLFLQMFMSGALTAQPVIYDYLITAVPIKNVVLNDRYL